MLHVQLGWLVLAEETLLILLRGIASGHAASCTANICHVDESAEVAVGVTGRSGRIRSGLLFLKNTSEVKFTCASQNLLSLVNFTSDVRFTSDNRFA